MIRFARLQLRTTDLDGARAFYAAVLGADARGGADVVPLPAEAVARGARPHWLGQLGVADVEATARAFVARGASQLGPTRPAGHGGDLAILRDPGGAVVGLATAPLAADARPAGAPADVVWHLLNTTDPARAAASYRDLFGWHLTERVDLGAHGVHQQFAWTAGAPSVGAIADVAGRPGVVHPHWLFHFRVVAFDAAVAAVRAAGGLVVGPFALPGGGRLAVCDDAQGAAFALRGPAA
jgi:predicted enzyme related to lactoylglutathione lyase